MCVSATGGFENRGGGLQRWSDIVTWPKEARGKDMIRSEIGKCQICDSVNVLPHHCPKCGKRACDEKQCRLLIQDERMCQVRRQTVAL